MVTQELPPASSAASGEGRVPVGNPSGSSSASASPPHSSPPAQKSGTSPVNALETSMGSANKITAIQNHRISMPFTDYTTTTLQTISTRFSNNTGTDGMHNASNVIHGAGVVGAGVGSVGGGAETARPSFAPTLPRGSMFGNAIPIPGKPAVFTKFPTLRGSSNEGQPVRSAVANLSPRLVNNICDSAIAVPSPQVQQLMREEEQRRQLEEKLREKMKEQGMLEESQSTEEQPSTSSPSVSQVGGKRRSTLGNRGSVTLRRRFGSNKGGSTGTGGSPAPAPTTSTLQSEMAREDDMGSPLQQRSPPKAGATGVNAKLPLTQNDFLHLLTSGIDVDSLWRNDVPQIEEAVQALASAGTPKSNDNVEPTAPHPRTENVSPRSTVHFDQRGGKRTTSPSHQNAHANANSPRYSHSLTTKGHHSPIADNSGERDPASQLNGGAHSPHLSGDPSLLSHSSNKSPIPSPSPPLPQVMLVSGGKFASGTNGNTANTGPPPNNNGNPISASGRAHIANFSINSTSVLGGESIASSHPGAGGGLPPSAGAPSARSCISQKQRQRIGQSVSPPAGGSDVDGSTDSTLFRNQPQHTACPIGSDNSPESSEYYWNHNKEGDESRLDQGTTNHHNHENHSHAGPNSPALATFRKRNTNAASPIQNRHNTKSSPRSVSASTSESGSPTFKRQAGKKGGSTGRGKGPAGKKKGGARKSGKASGKSTSTLNCSELSSKRLPGGGEEDAYEEEDPFSPSSPPSKTNATCASLVPPTSLSGEQDEMAHHIPISPGMLVPPHPPLSNIWNVPSTKGEHDALEDTESDEEATRRIASKYNTHIPLFAPPSAGALNSEGTLVSDPSGGKFSVSGTGSTGSDISVPGWVAKQLEEERRRTEEAQRALEKAKQGAFQHNRQPHTPPENRTSPGGRFTEGTAPPAGGHHPSGFHVEGDASNADNGTNSGSHRSPRPQHTRSPFFGMEGDGGGQPGSGSRTGILTIGSHNSSGTCEPVGARRSFKDMVNVHSPGPQTHALHHTNPLGFVQAVEEEDESVIRDMSSHGDDADERESRADSQHQQRVCRIHSYLSLVSSATTVHPGSSRTHTPMSDDSHRAYKPQIVYTFQHHHSHSPNDSLVHSPSHRGRLRLQGSGTAASSSTSSAHSLLGMSPSAPREIAMEAELEQEFRELNLRLTNADEMPLRQLQKRNPQAGIGAHVSRKV